MRHLTPSILSEVTGGETRGDLPVSEITVITTDSRTVVPGCLFAAIPGQTADGHDYIPMAAEKGASCVLCSRFVDADIPQIRVEDTLTALRQIAAFYRCQFDIPFVGVTGSVGKTTAKEMIGAVLSERFRTLRTEKNFNNELGVPLTIFRLREEHEAAVVEMGISDFGEMTRLAEMVHPDIAVFTLIGDAHLEFLGDRAGVLRAKGEIVSGMPEDGVVIANGDDDTLRGHDFGRRTVWFGLRESCDVRASQVENDGTSAVRCVVEAGERRIPVRIPAFGRHMVYAALMGAAVGLELGLSDDEIARGVAAYETVGSRGRVLETGSVTILDDCYNANPTSTAAALDTLASMPGRHVAILGDMLELGESGPALHEAIGRKAAGAAALVLACGEVSRSIAAGAGDGARWFPEADALIDALPALIRPGDAVLVKASHAMGFDAVVDALRKLDPSGGQEEPAT